MAFYGKYINGIGDADYLKLIDQSFEMFHPTGELPNISMLYNPLLDSFIEGFFWGNNWWIQNSYGFAYSSVPFLSEPWFTILQHSMDKYWSRIGDGNRMGGDDFNDFGYPILALVAPDGCLGDCVFPNAIVYKQGDGRFQIHDWFFEATAAGVVIHSEILLRKHDERITKLYLPFMERSCNFIETARDEKNDMFLVGPACNLLAPSYGAAPPAKDGEAPVKAYLCGLSVTYAAALERMVELFLMVGETKKAEIYKDRLNRTKRALQNFVHPEGYLVKSIEQNGTKHGVTGQSKYGYLEGVANVDAVALEAVDDSLAWSIYETISKTKGIRPFDLMLTNYPGLDDTYFHYFNDYNYDIIDYGNWVNGGWWGTVEGRAILMYSKLERFEDIYKAARRAMDWAVEYRMDAPFTQCGENTHNIWSDREGVIPVSVMIDNFAVPAATIRGLFDYKYKHNSLMVSPHITEKITEYHQSQPVYFGEKAIYISIANSGSEKISKVLLNGNEIEFKGKSIELLYDALSLENKLEIFCGESDFSINASRNPIENPEDFKNHISDDLASEYDKFRRIYEKASDINPFSMLSQFSKEVLAAIEACGQRRIIPLDDKNKFREMTKTKVLEIYKLYDSSASNLIEGFKKYFPYEYYNN